MIVRNQNSRNVFCITQLHHSLMTGALADAWKPDFTSTLNAFDKVKKAALLHDFGWLDWEASPEVNPETNHPHDFLDMPKKAHLDIWRNGLFDTAALDPLIGLLVLRHNMTLAKKDAESDESVKKFMDLMNIEDALLEDHILDIMPELNRAELKRMSAFILLMDYISLRMLMGTTRENPFGPPPAFDGINFEMKPLENAPETMSLSPWPFAKEIFEWKAWGWVHKQGERFESLPAPSKKDMLFTLVPG